MLLYKIYQLLYISVLIILVKAFIGLKSTLLYIWCVPFCTSQTLRSSNIDLKFTARSSQILENKTLSFWCLSHIHEQFLLTLSCLTCSYF